MITFKLVFLVSCFEKFSLHKLVKIFSYINFMRYIVPFFIVSLTMSLELNVLWYEKIMFNIFHTNVQIFSAIYIENAIISPLICNITFVINQWCVYLGSIFSFFSSSMTYFFKSYTVIMIAFLKKVLGIK